MAFKDVLVPTDFGPGSRAALSQAMDSLGPEGGKVTVLPVLDQHLVDSIRACFPDTTPEALTTHMQNKAREQYTQLIAGMERDKVACELVLVTGVPCLKIVQLACDLDVDALLMAVHRGPERVEQLLFGSTVERVLRLTSRPILIVPETIELGVA